MNKKMIKVVLIILVVIFALIGLEAGIRGLAKVTEDVKTQNEQKKEQKEYEKTEEYKTEVYLESSVQKVVNYIASGDYESLYEVLDYDYKEFMDFKTAEDLKNYLETMLGGTPENATMMSYDMYGDKYVCSVLISTETKSETYTILVTPLKNDKFTVIFDNISYIEKVDSRFSYSDKEVTYKVLYKAGESNIAIFSIDATNNTSQTMKGSFAGTCLKKSDHNQYYVANTKELENIEIAPGETKRINIKINVDGGSIYEDISLTISFRDESGKELSRTVSLEQFYFEY